MSFLEKWFKSSKAYWPTPTRWVTFASLPLIPIIILSHILLLWKLQYIAWPENFIWPYFHLSGLTLYKDIFYIYPPLYVLLLSGWFKIVGISLVNLQIISWIVVAITDWLLYLVAKKKIWPVLIYIPLQIYFEGNGLWPDQLLAPIFLAAWLFSSKRQFFLLGITLALALLTKQTASYFVLGILFAAGFSKRVFLGLASVGIMAGTYFLLQNNFWQFWEQNIIYIFSHHVGNSLQTLWPNRQQIIISILVFLPAMAVSIKNNRRLALLTLLAGLGIFTRFEYFHFQPALPFAALLISESFLARPFFLIFGLVVLRMVTQTTGLPPRFYTNDILTNVRTINTLIPPGSKTLIINSWDHYYFLTGTLPVGNFFFSSTPWNWSYDDLQQKEVEILAREQPKFVVFGRCFLINNTCYEPGIIDLYIKSHYRQVLKLPDGTGIFENNPVGLREKIQAPNGQK